MLKEAKSKKGHGHGHGHGHGGVKMPEFDPYTHLNMSEQEQGNLKKYTEYEAFEWMEETQKLATGDSFVQKVNSQLPQGHFEIKCITDSYFAILGKCEY